MSATGRAQAHYFWESIRRSCSFEPGKHFESGMSLFGNSFGAGCEKEICEEEVLVSVSILDTPLEDKSEDRVLTLVLGSRTLFDAGNLEELDVSYWNRKQVKKPVNRKDVNEESYSKEKQTKKLSCWRRQLIVGKSGEFYSASSVSCLSFF